MGSRTNLYSDRRWILLICRLKSRPRSPGWGLGRAREEPARNQAVGRGLKHVPAPEARGGRAGKRGPTPPAPQLHPPSGAPSTSARLGATGSEQLPGGATSLAWSRFSLTVGFYLQPGALQPSCAGKAAADARGRETTPADPRRGCGPAARGRASAGLRLRPPLLQSSPHMHSTRGCRAGALSGDLLAAVRGMAAPWEKEVRSPSGHLPLGKKWGMGSLPGLIALRKSHSPSDQGGEEDITSESLRSGSTRPHPKHKGT